MTLLYRQTKFSQINIMVSYIHRYNWAMPQRIHFLTFKHRTQNENMHEGLINCLHTYKYNIKHQIY